MAPALLADLFKFNHWSLLIGLGIVCGYALMLFRARRAGLPVREMENGALCAIVAGFVISRTVEVLCYRPEELRLKGWITLIDVTAGISSYGGFAGGLLGVAVFYAIKRKSWWPEADVLIEAMTLGWVFGRLGCTIALDHPGPKTASFLGFQADDGLRHNMGFYEFLLTLLVLVPINLILAKRRAPVGSRIAWICLLYGAGRFGLDFFRATDVPQADPRYGGLTLAHYCSAALFLFGGWVLVRVRRGTLQPATTTGR